MGEYELIYPPESLEQMGEYQRYIQAAKTTWEEFHSGTKMKKLIE
jgi:hypothetical protein